MKRQHACSITRRHRVIHTHLDEREVFDGRAAMTGAKP